MSRHSHLYKTARWQKRRKAQLESEPLCAYCHQEGRLVPATVADHKTPHGGDLELFEGELQSLCTNCHSSVKQREERSGYRQGADADGVPTDPGHHWHQGEAKNYRPRPGKTARGLDF